MSVTHNEPVPSGSREDETGEEEEGEVLVDVQTLAMQDRQLTNTYIWAAMPRPQLLVAMDTRYLEL